MKVAVVGGCGSGKTTIVEHLQSRGFDAYVVGQEHSGVGALWARQSPDALVYLDVTLEAVRQRRDENWPEWLFKQQQTRLQDARSAASIRVNTVTLSVQEAIQQIIEQLEAKGIVQSSSDSDNDDSVR